MLFNLKIIFFISIKILHVCTSSELYEDAKTLDALVKKEDEKKYEKFNVPPSDYMYNFAVESSPPSPSNSKADVLKMLQITAKYGGKCKSMTYKGCLRYHARTIPKEDRCELPERGCNRRAKYSRISGFCNNLNSPNTGKANIPYGRLLKAAYSDGISELRKARNKMDLPNPRIMGNLIDKTSKFKDANMKCDNHTNNFAGIMFSQLIAHDTSSRKAVAMKGNNSNGISCCESSYSGPLKKKQIHSACIPIELPNNDSFYASKNIFCQSYVRMQPTLEVDCKILYEHENTVTSFLDLNVIYSNSNEDLQKLRSNNFGLFKMDEKNNFPVDDQLNPTAGDFRFGQTPLLALIHSLFYRFHNIVAINLKVLNPSWSDDDLFFEARRIVIACYQHIIYYEWLPLVLGKKLCKHPDLNCRGTLSTDKYDENVDPVTLIEYANNAFRWFHVNIPSNAEVVNDSGELVEQIRLSKLYLDIKPLDNKFKYYGFIRGMMKQKQRMNLPGYTDEVRNLFLKTKYRNQDVGVDGFILDVMRSRDSGTARFIDYYGMCQSKKINNWEDLESDFENEHFKLLKEMYTHVRDIDLMVGILLEKRCGNLMGNIGGCLVAKQFSNFKYGDRFFYSHRNNPHSFTPAQLKAVRKITFSSFVCMTTENNITRVPKQGFVAVSKENPYINCDELKPFDFSSFKQSE